jgi:A/G-specific adenine glycosylase
MAGYPVYGGRPAAVQKKFEGSDRQVRGLIMAELRASRIPVAGVQLAGVWPDAAQYERALTTLLRDGLAVVAEDGYALPE